MLQRARGVDNVEIELEDIVEAARQSRMIKNPYMTILQRKYRPQFIIACIFMIFQQFDVSPPNKRLAPVPSQPPVSVSYQEHETISEVKHVMPCAASIAKHTMHDECSGRKC